MSHRKDSQRYYTEAGQNYSQVEQLRIEGFVQSKLQHLHDQPGFNGIDNTGFSFNNCKQNRHHQTKGIAIKKYNTYKEDEERNKHQNLECFQQLERILVMQNKNLKEQNSYLLTYIQKIANKNHLLKQQLQSSLASNRLLQENLIKLEHNFVLLRQECERKMQVIVNKWIIYEKGVQRNKRISWMKSSSLTNQGEAMQIQSNMVCSMGNIKGLFHLKDRSGNRDSVDSRKVEEMTIKDYLTRCQTKIQSEALISFGVRHNKNLIKQSHIHYMPDTCSIQDMGNLSRARP